MSVSRLRCKNPQRIVDVKCKNVETPQRVECCNYFVVAWELGHFIYLAAIKLEILIRKKAIMSGRIKKCSSGNTIRSMKVGLRRDKSWADPHGSNAVMKMRRKLKKKLLQKYKSKVGVRGWKGCRRG